MVNSRSTQQSGNEENGQNIVSGSASPKSVVDGTNLNVSIPLPTLNSTGSTDNTGVPFFNLLPRFGSVQTTLGDNEATAGSDANTGSDANISTPGDDRLQPNGEETINNDDRFVAALATPGSGSSSGYSIF